jgi:hypothetical protein
MFIDGAWLQLDSREMAKTLPNAMYMVAEVTDFTQVKLTEFELSAHP